MILTEEHRISRSRHKELFRMMDRYCYLAKNLSNSVNYLLKQCYRIHRKLAQGEILDSWEKGMIYRANCAVRRYNRARPGKRPVRYIDGNGSLTADAYFLSWYMKTWEVYRAMPYATCSQICIQERCREWRSYFRGVQRRRDTWTLSAAGGGSSSRARTSRSMTKGMYVCPGSCRGSASGHGTGT